MNKDPSIPEPEPDEYVKAWGEDAHKPKKRSKVVYDAAAEVAQGEAEFEAEFNKEDAA
jgi:hypothetical protein